MTEMTKAGPKTFRIARSKKEPIPFDVELEQEDGEYETRTFHAKPKIAGSVILDLVASGSLGAEWQAAAIRKFFTESVVPEELDKFFDTLDHSDPPIDMLDMSSITNYLVEQYGERPTQSATP